MGRRVLLYAVLCAAGLLSVSCSAVRYVPEGGYLLNRNRIETDTEVPRAERIRAGEYDRFVRHAPARKLLGLNIPVAIYSASDTSKNYFLDRVFRSLGVEPVILDSSQMERSANNMASYTRSRGYLDSEVAYEVRTRRKKAWVTYSVRQGEPYRIGGISYQFRDENLRPVILRDTSASLLRSGDVFDIGEIDAERQRITENLRNQGYSDFTVNNITFLADSLGGDRTIDLTLVVRQYLKGYNERGEPEYENNKIYRINSIYIDPDYDPARSVADRHYYRDVDTLEYKGLNVLYRGRPKVREKVLQQAVNLYPDNFYSETQVQEAYSNLMRLGYFRSASILFENVTDRVKTDREGLELTFVGDGSDTEREATTREGYLQYNINCVPAMRQSYKVDLEGSMSSNFYAVSSTLGYQNRNLLRGAELFDASVTGRYEFTREERASYEIGGAASLSFPNFILPFEADRFNRRVNPRTRFELSANYQHRPYYSRMLSGGKLVYSWSNRKYSSFVVRPLDVNLISVNYIDDNFLESLMNPYLRAGYNSQLVAGVSGSYTFNSQLRQLNASRNSLVFRVNAETMGNLFGLYSHLFSTPHHDSAMGEDYYKVFGIRYARYFRVDFSFSNRIALGEKTGIAYRLLAGGGMSYGNSTPIPIDRMFYSGGSNSMRGWIARRLGPGSIPGTSSRYPTQVGNLKLEANIEFRFPVWGFLHSAVFFDLGNIWLAGDVDYDDPTLNPAAKFRFDRFYKQLGLNTGLGARLDFNRFIFRLDWGLRLHDPGLPEGERWIRKFRVRDTVLNLGVGYPF